MAGSPPGSGPDDTTWVPDRARAAPSPSEAPTWVPPPSTLALGASAHSHTGHGYDARPLLEPGTIVGSQYRIDDIIGSGAMGVVYRAHHLRLDRAVALKLRRTSHQDHARLEREARAMAKLSHPNVVAVYDVGTWDGDVYIAMEFVAGCSLRTWLEQTPRPWLAALEKCMQAGRGLAAAHAAGIVHRDFKPDNVLVGVDGRTRVADFGIARGDASPVPSEPGSDPALGPDLTGTGGMPGTPAYMAPEQFGGVADAKSDVFAFCVVTYEALFGARPFGGNSLPELLYNVSHGNVRKPPADSDVPDAVARVVLAGLAVDPSVRLPSMAVTLDLLARASMPRRATWIAVALLAAPLVVLAGIGVGWWLWPRSPTTIDADRDLVVVSADPERPVTMELVDPARPVESAAIAPTPTGERPLTEAERAQVEREGLGALAELVRGGTIPDPDSFDGLMDADMTSVAKAAIVGALQRDADNHLDKGGFVAPQWDGKSRLVCMADDKLVIENRTIDVEGTAITAMYGCQLHLVGCDVTADTVVEAMMHSEVTITGGTMKPRKALADVMFGRVTIVGVTVEGDPPVAVDADGGRVEIADSTLRGEIAVKANQEARVLVKGGALTGSTHAVDVNHGAVVELEGTRRTGSVHEARDGKVIERGATP